MVQIKRMRKRKVFGSRGVQVALTQIRALTKILSFCLLPSVILYLLCHNNGPDSSQNSSAAHPKKRIPPQLFEQMKREQMKREQMKKAEVMEYRAQQMKREKRKLPDHCNREDDVVREVVIKGERHTGTNWIESILRENIVRPHVIRRKPDETARKKLPKVRVMRDSPFFGWKHGFMPPKGWGQKLSDAEVLIVITRDVFTWLPKMFDIVSCCSIRLSPLCLFLYSTCMILTLALHPHIYLDTTLLDKFPF